MTSLNKNKSLVLFLSFSPKTYKRQAVDGEGPDIQFQGAVPDEQEERDGWPEGGEDPVQEVGWRLG